jgi:hypothetical protein
MDFIVGLPKTVQGYTTITVFVDRLTKMVRLAPAPTGVTAAMTANLFLHHVFRHHGMPAEVITDRGSQFACAFWEQFLTLLDSRPLLSTAYHAQTDGQTERMNRVLEDMLRHYVGPTLSDWDTLLPLAEFAINNSLNTSVQNTPFFLNYGRHPRTPLTRETQTSIPEADRKAHWVHRALAEAKRCLEAAQQRQKAYYDAKKQPVSYQPSDLVLLSTKNMAKQGKLMPKWIGPYPVVRMVGKAAVELALPPEARIHPTFHVSLIKPYTSDGPVQPAPPVGWLNGEPYWRVERILLHRDRHVGRKTVREFLVKWEGWTDEHNSWVPDCDFSDDVAQKTYWEWVRNH